MGKNLREDWTFGRVFGGGGFARVCEASNDAGVVHAAKFVKKQPGASREMLLADLAGIRNVVPVVDSGEIDDEYVIVMPMADYSLRGYLEEKGPLPQSETLRILVDVATALVDLEDEVVHRDLKPENILFLNDRWCLADFGISRYSEATTEAGETRKYHMTLPYAAPEQWLMERATSATDVYAFGIVAFELLEGSRPFQGIMEDLREQHLHSKPPEMASTSMLSSLVHECLFKSPQARPKPANLLERLRQAQEQGTDPRWKQLADANHAEIQRRATAHAESVREKTECDRRSQLSEAATHLWDRISGQFQNVIHTHLNAAHVDIRPDKNWNVSLNNAKFGLSYPKPQPSPIQKMPFDVIATATLSVLTPGDKHRSNRWAGRSHSLYFADVLKEGDYAWFETAFINTFTADGHMFRNLEPFAVDDLDDEDLHHALSSVIGGYQVAWEFTRIDAGNCDGLVERWLNWFALAAESKLFRPSRLPEFQVTRTWRR